MSGRRTSSSHTAQGQDLEVDLDAANQLEIEIELLMAAGYSRDAAIKILLEKKKKQQQSDQSVHGQSTSPRFRSSSGGSIVAPNQTQHNQRLSSGGSVAFNNSNSRSSHAVVSANYLRFVIRLTFHFLGATRRRGSVILRRRSRACDAKLLRKESVEEAVDGLDQFLA